MLEELQRAQEVMGEKTVVAAVWQYFLLTYAAGCTLRFTSRRRRTGQALMNDSAILKHHRKIRPKAYFHPPPAAA